ncbi:rhamnulokinase [Paenibacillus fonticola]|uniref:rhamnulokinase n=1 Tax=Paenibacillus fonticola TaxID=379896 RepID=UPI0003679796|nr:rhamnulokinase [Paenibacillus fonticola]
MNNYIAVDIGASSGRLVKGTLHNEQIELQEIHRFDNSFAEKGGHHYWDVDYLFAEIIKGLQQAKQEGVDSCTLGIDTWGVDYVLLDDDGKRIHDVYAYRDGRTAQAADQLHQAISRSAVYSKTGIQEQPFNTLYQLYVHDSDQLSRAGQIVLVPDYLYYRLTGKIMNEMTNASTMQLLNLDTKEFDADLLALLKLRRDQFARLAAPGERLGMISPELQKRYDLPACELIVVPTHDTASAVVGVPAAQDKPWAYISSGTWSLLGVERSSPLNTPAAMEANYTNEWGAYGTFRFLKNIMGLWMIQEVRREAQNSHNYAELAALALEEEPFRHLVPCNDNRFLNPDSMIREIQNSCFETTGEAPQTIGQLARCIFDSLALTYRDSIHELQELTNETLEAIYIVGGGANNELLCKLTADIAGVEVMAGPAEATALGNIIVQMISMGEVPQLHDARRLVASSFKVKKFSPDPIQEQHEIFARWEQIKTKQIKSKR